MFSPPEYASSRLRNVLAAWEASSEEHTFFRGVSEASLDRANESIGGRQLPADLRALYRVTDGAFLCGGDFRINELSADAPGPGLVYTTNELRDVGWDVPDEVVIFASSADHHYGVWLPRDASPSNPRPVIDIAGGRFLAIVGNDVASFLVGYTAILLSIADFADVAVEALGAPEELVGDGYDAETLRRWASPNLPAKPDAFAARWTAEEIRAYVANETKASR